MFNVKKQIKDFFFVSIQVHVFRFLFIFKVCTMLSMSTFTQLLPISADTIIDTRDTSGEISQSLVGSSPIIIVEQSYRNPQPLFITVPCEKPQVNAVKKRLSSAPLPEDIMTQSRLSKYAMHDFIGA